ncbi:MAG: SRPBCC family protein [Ilumatobacteraceae bacterium]
MSIHSDRRYAFAASADEVWAALTRVDEYAHWWPWLVGFDGTDFEVGSRWHCTVRSPLRYSVHFDVELVEVRAAELAAAKVGGDITGTATLTVTPFDRGNDRGRVDRGRDEHGSDLRLVSDLQSNVGLVATVDRWAPRLAAASHRWILDTGFRQFRDRTGLAPRGRSVRA